MSYFYLKPVQGNVSLHILEECVLERWKYFQESLNTPTKFCQYILEGSPYDNIGHFMLSYLSIISNDQHFSNIVLNYEVNLFFNRITNTSVDGLRLFSKYILKRSHYIKQHNLVLCSVLEQLCNKIQLKHVAQHLSEEDHDLECNVYNVNIHFTMCLPLIARRLIEVNHGVANIPCSKWKLLLKILFKNHLINRNLKSNKTSSLDPRWRELISKLNYTVKFTNTNSRLLKYTDIDEKSMFFPLCMKNLHKCLRTNHRLSHNARFRYSLFLKEIGMPVQQSIYFWQEEYSKPCQHQSICTHSWEKDSNKYIYGVRHLYGLEGSRKNYCMVNCNVIQHNAQAEGGCPFKHFDTDNLKKLVDFNVVSEANWDDILQNIRSTKYTDACKIYKNAVLNFFQSCVNNDSFNPVSYFTELNLASEFIYDSVSTIEEQSTNNS